jgi:hypothetical protein
MGSKRTDEYNERMQSLLRRFVNYAKKLDLSREEIAKMMGVQPRAVHHWLVGHRLPTNMPRMEKVIDKLRLRVQGMPKQEVLPLHLRANGPGMAEGLLPPSAQTSGTMLERVSQESWKKGYSAGFEAGFDTAWRAVQQTKEVRT